MRKLCITFFSLIFLIGFVNDTYAQSKRKKSSHFKNRTTIKKANSRTIANYKGEKNSYNRYAYSGLGISFNALNYFGDLSPTDSKLSTDFGFTKLGMGLSYFHRYGPRYTIMAQYLYGSIQGSDTESASATDKENAIFRNKRNLSFRNTIHELSVLNYIDLFDNQRGYMRRVKWTPYGYIGFSVFYHNPQAIAPSKDLKGNNLSVAGKYVDLQPLKTEGQSYSLIQVAVPFGLGARFRLTDEMDIWADIGLRYTFTDYLDDVSNTYLDLSTLSPLAQAMSYRTNEKGSPTNPTPSGIPGVNVQSGYGKAGDKRGGSTQNDIYSVASIRFSYIIGVNYKKPKFR